MQIFHLNSIAGTCKLLCDYGNTHGHPSTYLTTKFSNTFKHNDPRYVRGKYTFLIESFLEAITHDAVIFHGNMRQIKYFRHFTDNPFIYAHGSDIRNRYEENKDRFALVRHIFVSTPDLLDHVGDFEATYIPNPVDPYFTKPDTGLSERPKERAFTIQYAADAEARSIAKEHDLELEILPRNIPHKELRYVMARYTHYVDVKRDGLGNLLTSKEKGVYSMTALEALQMGLKVLTLDGVTSTLPAEHTLENSGRLFIDTLNRYVVRLW